MKNLLISIFSALVFATSCVKHAEVDENRTLKLTFDTIRITQGITQYLAAKDMSAAEITWQSADTTIATIDNRGVVNGINAGQTLITASSKKYNSQAKCVVIVAENKVSNMQVSDVSVGANGSIFVIGTDVVSPTGGFGIYQLKNNILDKMPYCAGINIAVSPTGKPWVVNKSKLIFRYREDGLPWDELYGSANDIAIGAEGSVFIVSNTLITGGGFLVMKWQNDAFGWATLPSINAVRIAVDPSGRPWVTTVANKVYRYDGSGWVLVSAPSANDIGIGADGTVFITGTDTNKSIYRLDRQTNTWLTQPEKSAISISVTPAGKAVFITPQGYLYK